MSINCRPILSGKEINEVKKVKGDLEEKINKFKRRAFEFDPSQKHVINIVIKYTECVCKNSLFL